MDISKSSLLLTCLFTLYTVNKGQETLTYHIPEEKPPNTFVGNIARDAGIVDSGIQGSIAYSYLSNDVPATNMFRLNTTTGDLITSIAIDREEMCEFSSSCFVTMEIVASSPEDVFFRIISLKIYIDDINDNSPQFPSDVVELDIPENVQMKATFSIQEATDKDSDRNNTVSRYYIISGSSPFRLKELKNLDGSPKLYLEVISNLDREQTPSYSLVIFAEDNGVPRRSGSATINVNVLDINDNAPVFDLSDYNVTIGEDIQPNTVILNLNASDIDEGRNAQIRYRLNSRQTADIQNTFSVDEMTGNLSVISTLNPSIEYYRVIVEVIDKAEQPLFSQAIVNVYVLDTRNSAPIIKLNLLSEKDYAEISESARIGTVVAYFRVVDSDTGNNGIVSCFIQSTKFELQEFRSMQYKVKLSGSLDREITPDYRVTVICKDKGATPLSAYETFTVNVRDVNDNAPRFSQDTYELTMIENNNIGDFVLKVMATDMDSVHDKHIKYILNSNDSQYLSIDSNSGVITANTVFDREVQSIFIVNVYADDSGSPPLTSTATLILNIEDVNDCNPVFAQTRFNFHVSENLSEGIIVGILSATDKDTEKYGNITFSLGPNSNGVPFRVTLDGRIISKSVLDREKQSRYDFRVTANDGGDSPLFSTADVTVFVQDDNDNLPVILYPNNYNKTIRINNEVTHHTPIARVIAFDADDGFNGELRYSLKSENTTQYLVINPSTGELFPAKDLTFQKYSIVQSYTVIVSDRGDTPLFSTADLRLEIGPFSAPPSSGANDMKLTFIAIAIGVVTVMVAVIVVATLLVVRQMDRKKFTSNRNCYSQKQNNLQIDTFKEPILNDSSDSIRPGVIYHVQVPGEDSKDSKELQVGSQFSKREDATGTTSDRQNMFRQPSPIDMITQLRMEVADKLKNEECSQERVCTHGDEFDINSTSDSGRGGSEEDVRFLHTDTSLLSNETESSRGHRNKMNSNRLPHRSSRKVTFEDSKHKTIGDKVSLNNMYLHNNAKYIEKERDLCRNTMRTSEHYPQLSSHSQNIDESSPSVSRDFHSDSNDGSDKDLHEFTFVNNRLRDNRLPQNPSRQESAVFVQDFRDIQV